MTALSWPCLTFARAVDCNVPLLAAFVTLPLSQWYVTAFTPCALPFASSVTALTSAVAALTVALAFRVLAVGNSSSSLVVSFALAFALAAVNRNVAEAAAIVSLSSLTFAFALVYGVYAFSIVRCLVILPLVPLLF